MTDAEITQRVYDLVGDVVREYAPHELSVFQLKRANGSLVPSPQQRSDRDLTHAFASEFGDSTKVVLESLVLVMGTLKAAFELVKVVRDRKGSTQVIPEVLMERWQAHLVAEGMSSDRASQIAAAFSADFARLVKQS